MERAARPLSHLGRYKRIKWSKASAGACLNQLFFVPGRGSIGKEKSLLWAVGEIHADPDSLFIFSQAASAGYRDSQIHPT